LLVLLPLGAEGIVAAEQPYLCSLLCGCLIGAVAAGVAEVWRGALSAHALAPNGGEKWEIL